MSAASVTMRGLRIRVYDDQHGVAEPGLGKTLDLSCFLGHAARLHSGRLARHFGVVGRIGHLGTAVRSGTKLSLVARVHLQSGVNTARLQLVKGSPHITNFGESGRHGAYGEVLRRDVAQLAPG